MPSPDPLTMTPSVVTFTASNFPPNTIVAAINRNNFSRFPAPWAPLSDDAGMLVQVTNNSVNSPVAPMLTDVISDPVEGVTRYSIFAELTTVQPGQTVTEIVAGIPVTSMFLVLYSLSSELPDTSGGFTCSVAAWRL